MLQVSIAHVIAVIGALAATIIALFAVIMDYTRRERKHLDDCVNEKEAIRKELEIVRAGLAEARKQMHANEHQLEANNRMVQALVNKLSQPS